LRRGSCACVPGCFLSSLAPARRALNCHDVLYLAPADGSVCNPDALHLLVGCFGGGLVAVWRR
jgi:hypothetical protein